MAKKKVSRSSNDQQVSVAYQKPIELSRESSMEDHDSSEEKFQNLKSLNAILLKQTMDKRHQIESLSQTKDALETELARFGTEKTLLHDELRGSSDENLALRLELDLFMGFVESRFKEMGFGVDLLVKEKSDRDCEIKDLRREANDLILKIENQSREFIRVCEEKDSIKSGFDLKSEEVNRLKESVVRMEKKELSLVEEAGKLRSLNDRMVKEMKKRDGLVQRVKEEKTDLEKTLVEKIREMNDLKSEIKGLVKEKMEVEMVERDQKGMIVKLEKKLGALNEIVKSLTKEEKGLRDQVIRLEKELDGVKEEAKGMEDHINALVKEKSIKEYELEGLLVENNSIKKQVEMTLEESSYKEKLVDHLVGEKSELAKRIALQDKEIVELKELADEQKRAAAQLRKDYNDQTKTKTKIEATMEKLSCSGSQLKDALALVEAERDNAGKALDEGKRSRLALNEKIVELEKRIDANRKEFEKVKGEKGRLTKEKKELENRSEYLRKEKGNLQKDIMERERAMAALKTELESARTNAKRGLTMLTSVSTQVCGVEIKKSKQKRENGKDSYSVELEAIKNAFKNKESVVEEMKKEVEKMKHSVEDAHKKKSFWTIVSSVATLFMVASAAYAAAIK
ncbi:unnamed protein product [Cochlearia groenlandica]